MKPLILLWLAIFTLAWVTIGYTQDFLISPIWVINAFAAFFLIRLRKQLSHDLLILLYAFSAIFTASLLSDQVKTVEQRFLLCGISALQIWLFIKLHLALSRIKGLRFKHTIILTLPIILSAFAGSLLFAAIFQVGRNYLEFIDYFLEQAATGLSVICLLYGAKQWSSIPLIDYFYLAAALLIQYVISHDQIFYACMVLPLLMCYFAVKYKVKAFCWLIGLMTLICGCYAAMPLAGEYWSDAQIHMLSRISAYRLALGIYLILFLFICELYMRNQRLYLRLQRVTFNDELTGLKNRHSLKEQVFAKSAVKQGCVILLDVDDFKSVNDQYGHHVGDLVLIHLAQILKKSCPPESFISRWGGEEFLIVTADCTADTGRALCKSILDRCAATPFHHGDLSLNLSFSMGMTAFKQLDISNYSSMLQHVDQCLYLAKALGKNQYQFKEYPYPN